MGTKFSRWTRIKSPDPGHGLDQPGVCDDDHIRTTRRASHVGGFPDFSDGIWAVLCSHPHAVDVVPIPAQPGYCFLFKKRTFRWGFGGRLAPRATEGSQSSFLCSNNIFKIMNSSYNGLWEKCLKSEVLADAFKTRNCLLLACGWHLFQQGGPGHICGSSHSWVSGRISGWAEVRSSDKKLKPQWKDKSGDICIFSIGVGNHPVKDQIVNNWGFGDTHSLCLMCF